MSDLLDGEANNEPGPVEEPKNEELQYEIPEFLQDVEGITELGDLLHEPALKTVKDTKTLVKNYLNAQKMVGRDKVIIPTKDSTDEERAAFYKKIGLPDNLDAYELNKSEESLYDDSFYSGIKEQMFKNNVLPGQAKAIVEYLENYEKEQDDIFSRQNQEKVEQEIEVLKKEWGTAFETKLNVANTVLKDFADENVMNALKESGLGNNVNLVKLLNNIGEQMYKEKKIDTPHPSMGVTRDEAQKELSEMLSNFDHAFHNSSHPDHQKAVERFAKLNSIATAQ